MVAAEALPVRIAKRIVTVRSQRALLDADLAALYADFMITLKNQELAVLRSQFVISKRAGRGGRAYALHAFTEHGAVMAATVLNSRRAIDVSIFVVRAFVHMREAMAERISLGKRLDELESRLEKRLATHDQAIAEILEAIRQLVAPIPSPRKTPIGFVR